MQIVRAQFTKSAVMPSDWPNDNLPHIALVGRSNVGKSSLINCLANNFKLARTSNVPGKTRLINFYMVNEAFYFVDLPGYGFANVSKDEQSKWGGMIDEYLSSNINVKMIVQIIDIRHTPTAEDVQMNRWIKHFGYKHLIVASKSDKLSKAAVNKNLTDIRKVLRVSPNSKLIPFSAQSRLGKDELLGEFDSVIPI